MIKTMKLRRLTGYGRPFTYSIKEENEMGYIRFMDNEHKAFYYDMLSKTHNDDIYHQAFSMRWEFVRRQDAISIFSLISKTVELTRRAFHQHGRQAVRVDCAVWPLISGTAGQKREKNSIPHLMSCLTAALHRTFLKQSGCAILNIAGA